MMNMIEIDDIDKRILFELERNARIPDVKLAKIVRKSKDAVRYRIKSLEEKKIITGYKTWIDMAKLGFGSSTLYLSLINLPDKKEKLIEYIKNDSRTYWLGVAEGSWNVGVSYFVKSNEELFDMKHKLLSKFGDIIIDIRITSLVGVSIHEKNFLVNEVTKLTSFTEKVEENELDEMSKKILKEIFWNATENIATLADKLDTTIDVVRNRIRNMEEKRIIIRYSAIIDYQKIGYEFYKSFIYLKKFNEGLFVDMNDYIKNSKVMINMVRQIAPWDFEIVSFARSFAEYDRTMGEFTKKFVENVQKIESATMSTDVIFPCKKLPFN
jgi:DNA-binding Lrp family transcriptional regulator